MTGPAAPAARNAGELGLWMCVALVVGNTIGISVFLLPASLAPFGFNALSGWLVTAAGCVVLGWVFASLARVLPAADGPFAYVRDTLGEVPAFAAVWCYWVSCWAGNPVIAIGVVAYLQPLAPPLAAVPTPALALAVLWAPIAVNLLGVRAGGRVQIATTVLKLAPMAVVIGLGVWIAASAPASLTRHLPATPLSLPRTMAAATLTLFAMLGLECAAIPAGRVRDRARTIPLATMIGVAATAAIYVAVSIVPMLLLPQAALAASPAPFADLLERFLAPGSGRWLSLFVVVSGLGALNGWILVTGELTRALAAAGTLPAPLARVNARGAPWAALALTGAMSSALVLMNYTGSLVKVFTFLINLVTAASLPLYLLCSLALAALWLRGRRAGAAWPLAFGLAGAAYCLFVFVGVGWEPLKWALVLAAAGLPVWALQRWRARPRPA